MAEAQVQQPSSLAEQYLLEKVEKQDVATKPIDIEKPENPVNAPSEEAANEKVEGKADSVAEGTGEISSASAPDASAENTEGVSVAGNSEVSPAAAEESNETNEEENSSNEEATEETPEIKLETAPADFRFPTTNQTRHCFTRYIEYHRCIAAKGEDAQECQKFAKYYRSLCPGEWIDRWNEQRENGTFPGPL